MGGQLGWELLPCSGGSHLTPVLGQVLVIPGTTLLGSGANFKSAVPEGTGRRWERHVHSLWTVSCPEGLLGGM